MKCSKCGEEVQNNQGFCLKCGNPIQVDPDFNTIENELANSISVLLEDTVEDEETNSDYDELDDVEPMKTVDIPYDEINMELKVVNINREKKEFEIDEFDDFDDEDEEDEVVVQKKQVANKSSKTQHKKKKKNYTVPIVLGSIAFIVVVVIVVGIILFVADYNEKKTYIGNYERAVEANAEVDYDLAKEYALKAVELATSDVEELNARRLLDNIYSNAKTIDDVYANNILELINLGDGVDANYVRLVEYYTNSKQYTKINQLVRSIKADSTFVAIKEYMPEIPTASKGEENYTGYVVIKLEAAEGCDIYYSLNATDEFSSGVKYTDGVKILSEEKSKITFYAVDKNGVESQRGVYEYVVEEGKLAAPVVTPSSGSYSKFTQITVEVPEGMKAYYTLDGSNPTKESTEYTEPIDMPRGTSKIKVILFDESGKSSLVATESYNMSIQRGLTFTQAIELAKAKLIEDGKMDEEYKTVYGVMEINYDKAVSFGKDEYYIILATEVNSEGTVLSVSIIGVNTYDGALNMEIVDVEGEYELPSDEEDDLLGL